MLPWGRGYENSHFKEINTNFGWESEQVLINYGLIMVGVWVGNK